MIYKKITIILLIALLCFSIVDTVFAAASSDDVLGFGGFTIVEDPNTGELTIFGGASGNMRTDRANWIGSFDMLFAKYGKTITWITGVATITLVAVFIYLCVKSAFVASEHWIIKRQTMMAMLWVGVGTALMGSTTLILIIFQNIFV